MYNYQTERPKVFEEKNQRLFLAVRNRVHALLAQTGAITMECAAVLPDGIGAAKHWTIMACVGTALWNWANSTKYRTLSMAAYSSPENSRCRRLLIFY
jgi:hypothetical protein